MRKLNNKQKILIKNFIKNNPSAPQFLPVEVIDDTGEIENCNMYKNCWSDIERYYSDISISIYEQRPWWDSPELIYICNGFKFSNIDDARNYADYYFKLTKIVLGIESEWYL